MSNFEIERRRKAEISKLRSEALDKAEAFNTVITLRDDLAELTREFTVTSLNPHCKEKTQRLGLLRNRMTAIENDLSGAEAFCRRVDSQRLIDHDAALEKRDAEQQRQRKADLVEHERLIAEGRKRTALKARDHMAMKARIAAEEAALLKLIGA